MTTMQRRILIADDEETFRETTSALLADAGYACSSARDALEAERLLEKGFDLLLTDVRMPGNAQLGFRDGVQTSSGCAGCGGHGISDGGDCD